MWKLYDALEVLHARSPDEALREQLEEAEGHLKSALALCADHPQAFFELALVSYCLERDETEVRRLFELAARYDRAPRKGSEGLSKRIRSIAREIPGVVLFDADAKVAAQMPMRLVGWEWMLDHCHMTMGARRVLMRWLAKTILELP